MNALDQLQRLHRRGFALHALREKSKIPIRMGWSKGERLTWDQFKKEWVRGRNVGVRLGQASHVDGGYLAVIDCDVKVPEHREEMEAELAKILAGKSGRMWPVVISGRGNGSKHLYVQTEKPVKTLKLAQSKNMGEVKMPSARPSKKELEHFTPDRLAEGIRLRAAWEISLLGEGSQVVLPPSIHPDSGKAYTWVGEGPSGEIPLFLVPEDSGVSKIDTKVDTLKDFEPELINLAETGLTDEEIAQIVDGEGVEDRSDTAFKLCRRMAKLGLTRNQVVSILTEPGYALAEIGYDRKDTNNRALAAVWVDKYCWRKAERTALDLDAFETPVEETKLSEEEAKMQSEEIEGMKDWRDNLVRTQAGNATSPPRPLVANIIQIMDGELGIGAIQYDEFANSEIYGRNTPWGGRKGETLRDIDNAKILEWLSAHYRFEPSVDKINMAVALMADRNRLHPVREYLDGLVWDEKPRLENWLKTLLGAEAPKEYLKAISRKSICAMVKRIYEPGCAVPSMLILEGAQGAGKSRAARILSGDDWFSDSYFDVRNKDAIFGLRSKWVIEVGELASLHKNDLDAMKAFITSPTDYARAHFGKKFEQIKRQCVFIGTTNNHEYLKDKTGNRRFWPVPIQECDQERLKATRDQLFAEAKVFLDLGEELWIRPGTPEYEQLDQMHQERLVKDSIENLLKMVLDNPKIKPEEPFTLAELYKAMSDVEGPEQEALGTFKLDNGGNNRLGGLLRMMKYTSRKARKGGIPLQRWAKEWDVPSIDGTGGTDK